MLWLTKCYHVHIYFHSQRHVSSIFPDSSHKSYLCTTTHTTGTLDGIVFMPIWLELTKIISSHLLNYTMSCFISCHNLAKSGSRNQGLHHGWIEWLLEMTAVYVSCLHLDHHCIHSCYFSLLFHRCKNCW